MKPVLKALTISTVIVVMYPLIVLAATAPLGVLFGIPYASMVSSALMMPLELPAFIMRLLYQPAPLIVRTRIELTIMFIAWFFALNAALYYLPIRLFLEWKEQKTRLR